MKTPNFTHCDQEPVYIDHVPGKEYWYCKACKNEVIAPISVEEVKHEYNMGNFMTFAGMMLYTGDEKHEIQDY